MRKFFAIWFASLILLSSGTLQAVLHVCPEQGILLDEADCHMHEQQLQKDCCRKHDRVMPAGDCCTDTYVFGVSPKFGSVQPEDLKMPVLPDLGVCSLAVLVPEPASRFVSPVNHSPPAASPADIRTAVCVWRI